MAIILELDGVDDYLSLPSTIPIPVGSYIEFKYSANAGNASNIYRIAGKQSSFDGLLNVEPTMVRFRGNDSSDYSFSTGYTQPAVGVEFILRLERPTSSSFEMFLDGSSIGTVSTTTTYSFDQIGGFNSLVFSGQVHYVKRVDSFLVDTNNWYANTSNHGAGTPVITDSVAAVNATGVNMPTAALGQPGSAWIDLGGSGITVTGATANYNYSGIIATVDLTGEIIVTGATANYDYSGIQGTVTLDSEIIVTGQTANYNYTGIGGVVELTGSITVTGQTANYDYTGIPADIVLQGSIIVTGSTANYDYNGLSATIIIQGPITLNPKNIIRVARKSNAIRVKRKSNIIRVR